MIWIVPIFICFLVVITLLQRRAELSSLAEQRLKHQREDGLVVEFGWVREHLRDWPLAIDYKRELWLAKIGASILGPEIDVNRARRVSPDDEKRVRALLEAQGREVVVQFEIE